MLIQRLLLIISFIAVGCLTPSFGQTIIKATSVNQCGGENHIEIALVRRDSTLHFIRNDISFLPLYFWGTNFNYNQHLNDLPFSKKAINDTIYDTVFFPKLDFIVLISNPPFSYYNYCDSLANGSIVDCYSPGKPRIAGNFEDGQPTDTIFKYNYGGGLYSWIYSVGDVYSTKEFYVDGHLKRSFTNKGRSKESTYHPSGKLKEESFINGMGGLRIRKYYKSGELKQYTKNWSSSRYSTNGSLSSKVQVQSRFKRLFKSQDFINLSFNYKMRIRDTSSKNKCILYFKGNPSFLGVDIENLSEISVYDFDQAIFKVGNKKTHKVIKKYLQVEGKYQYVFNLYFKTDSDWVFSQFITKDDLWQTIQNMSPNF